MKRQNSAPTSSHGNTEETSKVELRDALARIRALTQELLDEGTEPIKVAYGLSSVAIAMALQLTDNPLVAMSALLAALQHQTTEKFQTDKVDSGEAYESGVPDDETVH